MRASWRHCWQLPLNWEAQNRLFSRGRHRTMTIKSVEEMTPVERLTMALKLAIDAPAGREADADKLVQALAAGLSEFEIETAKRAALKGQA